MDDSLDTDSNPERHIAHRQSRRINLSNFAPCLKISLAGGKQVLVPIDKMSSDAKRSVLVAKARDFVEFHLDRLMEMTLTPTEIKDLVRAVAEIDSLQREQFVTQINNSISSGLGREVQSIIRGAAQGAAEGTAAGFVKKMEAMDRAAKKAIDNAKTIEV